MTVTYLINNENLETKPPLRVSLEKDDSGQVDFCINGWPLFCLTLGGRLELYTLPMSLKEAGIQECPTHGHILLDTSP